MESTTIRINKEDKILLEKLQAEIFIQTDFKLTIPELMNYMLTLGKEDIFEKIIVELNKPSDIPWELHEGLIKDYIEITSDDIDDVVYG